EMLAASPLWINLGVRVRIDEDDRAGRARSRCLAELVFGALGGLLCNISFEDEHSGRRVDAIPVAEARGVVDLGDEGHAASLRSLRAWRTRWGSFIRTTALRRPSRWYVRSWPGVAPRGSP